MKNVSLFEKFLCLPEDSHWCNTNMKINVRSQNSGIGFMECYLNCLQSFLVPDNHEKLGLIFPLKILVYISLGSIALTKADPWKLRMDQIPSLLREPGKRKSGQERWKMERG